MPRLERTYEVWLGDTFVGYLHQRGDHCRFRLHPSYLNDPVRPVLGLAFEQNLEKVHAAALRLPPWFSNLLPEGRLRAWIAQERGVSEQREMELLAQVGHDLPGAVRVLAVPPGAVPVPADDEPAPALAPSRDDPTAGSLPESTAAGQPLGRFSLAGVQLKLSMVAVGDRLVLPLGGATGDWIVKFPDAALPHLPVVEYATMELARQVGIEVPQTRLLTRDELPDTPASMWQGEEAAAFAISRFDRGPGDSLVHIEDFAQVRDVWPDRKYDGSYETLARLVHRGYDVASLEEMVRRLALNVLVDNSDAHVKNWSLRYADPRRPVLSPAYDVVSVAPFSGFGGETALTLYGSRRADQVRVGSFERLGRGVDVAAGQLEAQAVTVVERALQAWPEVAERHLHGHPELVRAIGSMIEARSRTLRVGA